MPVSEDYVREERIKRVRRVVQAGQSHLVTLHEAVPSYLRLANPTGARSFYDRSHGLRARLPVDERRAWDIASGRMIDEQTHNTYSRLYKWIADTANAASRNLSDEVFYRFRNLPHPVWIFDVETNEVEKTIGTLGDALEQRLNLHVEQLRIDGEYEDVTPALRDAAGGWPHLRGQISDAVLDGYLRQMRARRTRSEISAAIGAAKEITEATMKVLAARNNVAPSSTKPDLQDWWKALRLQLADARIDASLGGSDGALLKLISAEVATVQSLGELRNKVGTGHGKGEHPAGLTSAHALLAVDTAHSITRFLS